MRVGLKLNEGHDLSTEYLCESGKIRLRRFLRMDGVIWEDLLLTFQTVISVGTWLGERGDVVDDLARPNGDSQHHVFFSQIRASTRTLSRFTSAPSPSMRGR